MIKRITSIMIAMIMMLSVVGVKTTPAQAATTPFMTVVWDGPVKEKVGNYYIWVKRTKDDYGNLNYELRSSKKANVKGTLLKNVTGEDVLTSIISNGQTIYYGVISEDDQMVIYRTSVTGKNHKKFRTVKNVQSLCGPITVFNNRLYYDRDTTEINGKATWSIYSVNLKNKNCRLEKVGFKGQSGYGRYITCDNESKSVKTQLYNVKSQNSTMLIKSFKSRVYNGNIYYGVWTDQGAYVKKTNLSGKKMEIVGEVLGRAGWHVSYLGKKMAYFKSWDNGGQKKLSYATKKIVRVK